MNSEHPFDEFKQRTSPGDAEMLKACDDVYRVIQAAKCILLQRRVKNFTAADVVAVAGMIYARIDSLALKRRGSCATE